MALSQTAVVSQVRRLVAEVGGVAAAYAASERGEWGIPAALNEFGEQGEVCALVYPGATESYLLGQGAHRHTYEVVIQVFAAGGELGDRIADAMQYTDRLIEKFATNVALGGAGGTNSAVFSRCSGLIKLEYAGLSYSGIEVALRVSEQATATPAYGEQP